MTNIFAALNINAQAFCRFTVEAWVIQQLQLQLPLINLFQINERKEHIYCDFRWPLT